MNGTIDGIHVISIHIGIPIGIGIGIDIPP